MSEQTKSVSQLLDDLRDSNYLKVAGGFAAGSLLFGVMLFCSRLLGGIEASGDLTTAAGLVLLIHGLGLSASFLVNQAARENLNAMHSQLLTLMFWTGTFLLTLVVVPTASAIVTILAAVSFVMMSGLTANLIIGVGSVGNPEEASSGEVAEISDLEMPVDSVAAVEKQTSRPPVQWLSRSELDDGAVEVSGMVKISFTAGQTQASAHVTLTPALPSRPEVECESLDDAEIEAVVGVCYAHGFRIDARRPASSKDSAVIEVGFQAISSASAHAAA